jgi:hypothetical protein
MENKETTSKLEKSTFEKIILVLDAITQSAGIDLKAIFFPTKENKISNNVPNYTKFQTKPFEKDKK